jgi:hypothetical protein
MAAKTTAQTPMVLMVAKRQKPAEFIVGPS